MATTLTFDEAILRTAQLSHDLNFKGAAILYSWPANGHTLAYIADKEANEAAVVPMQRFFLELGTRLRVQKLHVIAHSMGNRALIHALTQLAERQPSAARFRNVVMAAPDVDRRVFSQLADRFLGTARSVTLYASSTDKALLLAKQLQLGPRLGDADPLFVLDRLHSIDASVVNTDLLNHSYFADTRLLNDIQQILRFDAPLPRFSIERIGPLDPATWRFVPVR
jgi:esterase/lipase superfamily enzyme